MKKLLLLGALVVTMLPMTTFARGRIGVVVRPSFGYRYQGWYGPGFYGPWGNGPYAYGPYGYYGGFYGGYTSPNTGHVKLDTKVKDAEVYINGNYAGLSKDLKTMTLKPGDYGIEVREPGREPYYQNVHILAGKTIRLNPDLASPPAAS